jgi:hypothetical protein
VDLGDEQRFVDRFFDVVGRPVFDGGHDVFGFGRCTDHDDRKVRGQRLDVGDHFHPGFIGQEDVQK